MKDGITFVYKDMEYNFFSSFIDRFITNDIDVEIFFIFLFF